MPISKLSSGKYLVKVYLKALSGSYLRKQETFHGTTKEARGREKELLAELQSQTSLTSLSTVKISTFYDAVQLYLQYLTIRGRNNKDHLRRYGLIQRLFGGSALAQVSDQLQAWLLQSIGTRSNSTINRFITMVRAVFNYLLKLEVISKNPITSIRFPKMPEKPRDRTLNQEERERLLSTIKANYPNYYPFFYFMIIVPCRTSELVNAKREYYDPVYNVINIPDSKARIPITKPIPPEMIGYFKSLPTDVPYLFYRKKGNTYYPLNNYRHAWERSLKLCNLSNLRVHDLRHISSTDMYNMGVPERTIMSSAGWKTPMLSTYRHKDGMRDAQAIQQVLRGRDPQTIQF